MKVDVTGSIGHSQMIGGHVQSHCPPVADGSSVVLVCVGQTQRGGHWQTLSGSGQIGQLQVWAAAIEIPAKMTMKEVENCMLN